MTDSLNPTFETAVTGSYGLSVNHAKIGKFHLMRIAGTLTGALTKHTITLPDKYKEGYFISESAYAGNYRYTVEKMV